MISDASGTDTLEIRGYAPDDMRVSLPVNGSAAFGLDSRVELVLSFPGTGDEITLRYDEDLNGVDTVRFEDGTVLTRDALIAEVVGKGTDFAEFIAGTAGNDTIEPGGGDDTVEDVGGNDVYIFRAGDGRDIIDEDGSRYDSNTLRLPDHVPADVKAFRPADSNDLVLRLPDGDEILLPDLFLTYAGNITRVEFGNGNVWNQTTLRAAADSGFVPPYPREITGTNSGETLTGTALSEVIEGRLGSDTYVFQRGGGVDIIQSDTGRNEFNTLRIEGYDFAEARFERSPTDYADLVIRFDGTDDRITLRDAWYDGHTSSTYVNGEWLRTYWRMISTFAFDDQSLTYDQLVQHLLESQISDGDDAIAAIGSAETIEAGLGDDTISGDLGDDTIVFRQGDGNDVILPSSGSGRATLQIMDYAAADVTVLRDIYAKAGYVLTFAGSSDSITLVGSGRASLGGVDRIEFQDGTVWTGTTLDTLAPSAEGATGTPGDDWLRGTTGAELFEGFGGDDYIEADDGEDTIAFSRGDGVETVYGDDYPGFHLELRDIDPGDIRLLIVPVRQESVYTYSRPVELRITGSDDRMYLLDGEEGLDSITFGDGTVWNRTQIEAAFETFPAPAGGEITVDVSPYVSSHASTAADEIHLVPIFSDGAQQITFTYAAGGGHDVFVSLDAGYGHQNRMVMSGIASTDYDARLVPFTSPVNQYGEGPDLLLTFGTPDDSVRIVSPVGEWEPTAIREIAFSDGVIVSMDDLVAQAEAAELADPRALSGPVVLTRGTETGRYFAEPPFFPGGPGPIGNEELPPPPDDEPLPPPDGEPLPPPDGEPLPDDGPLDLFLADVLITDISVRKQAQEYILDVAPRAPDGSDAMEIWLGGIYALDLIAVTVESGGTDPEFITFYGSDLAALVPPPATTEGDDVIALEGMAPVTIEGQGGDDLITSDSAQTTFVYERGDGDDLVTAGSERFLSTQDNTLEFVGIAPEDVTLVQHGGDLLIRVQESAEGAGDGGVIRFIDGFYVDSYSAPTPYASRLGSITFDNGTAWSATDIEAAVRRELGTDGNDVVEDLDGPQVYDMKKGDDVVISDTNTNDSYVYRNGDGFDVVEDAGYNDGFAGQPGEDVLTFPDLLRSDIALVRDGYDLRIDILADAARGIAGGSITLKDAYFTDGGYNYLIERLVFADGSESLMSDEIQTLLDAQATDGDDALLAPGQSFVLEGGRGNDTMAGQAEADTYRYSRGDGHDEILEERDYDLATDVLELTDILRSDVTYEVTPAGLILRIAESAEGAGDAGSILIHGMLAGTDYPFEAEDAGVGIEKIVFGDGTEMTLGALSTELLAAQVTPFADYLEGSTGNDTIEGKAGDDILAGNAGADTYIYTRGDGADWIVDSAYESARVDRLVLHGIDPADVALRRGHDEDMILLVADSAPGAGDGGRIVVRDSLSTYPGQGIEEIAFDDGTVWLRDTFAGMIDVAGPTDGDDRVVGTDAADTLEGLQGDDLLQGEDGADTYVFARGDGADVVEDIYSNPNRIVVSGYEASELLFERRGIDGRDLIVRFADSADQIIVLNGLDNAYRALPVSQIELTDDGTIFTIAAIQASLVSGQSSDGDDVIVGSDLGDALQGGPGTDLVDGREGNDAYTFAAGDGDDRFADSGAYDDNDVLTLTDYAPEDLEYALRAGANSLDLVLFFSGTRDRVILENALADDREGVDRVIFADGTEWDRAEMRAQAIAFAQRPGAEPVLGFDGNDSFGGSSGDDTLSGGEGADSYTFRRGHGDDVIVEGPTQAFGTDRLSLPDFVSTEVSVARLFKGSDTVVLRFASSPDDSLTITDALAPDNAGVEQIAFSDGVTWTPATLLTLLDNNAPVATDDGYFTATSGEALVLAAATLLRNDFDADGDPVSIIAVQGGDDGFAEIDANGNIVFTPDADFYGPTQFTYTLSDGRNGITTGTVDLRVRPVAEARDDTGLTVAEDGFLTIDSVRLLSNDLDGDRMIVSQAYGAQNGSVSLASNGQITFTPDADFNGTDTFTYVANTPEGGRAEATVTVEVTPVNDAPDARDNSGFVTDEDVPIQIVASLLAVNDSDPDGEPLTLTSVSSSDTMDVTLTEDGVILATPRAYFYGQAYFDYTVEDAAGASDTARVFVTVNPVNNAPEPVRDTVTTDEDVPFVIAASDLLGNDIDRDNDLLTITSLTGFDYGGNATLLDNGTILFEPNANFNGTGRFNYVVSDGEGGSAIGTVDVVINPVNDRPVARDDSYRSAAFSTVLRGTEDVALVIPIAELMKNDSDVESQALSFENVSNPGDGVIEIVGGNVVFTPDQDFWGETTFSYLVSDPQGLVDDATVTLFFENVGDAPPVAVPDEILVYEDVPITIPAALLLANDTDIDRDPLEISGWRLPNFAEQFFDPFTGSLDRDENGDFVYTPALNETRENGFYYYVTDNADGTTEGYVDITIIAVNDQPSAVPDSVASTPLDVPLVVRIADILANDFDVDDDPDGPKSISFVGVDSASVGTATVRDGFIVLDVPAGYSGPVELVYRITDTEGVEDTTTITAIVEGSYARLLTGTPQDDLLIGNALNETVEGLAGADIIESGAGSDTVRGGAGEDTILAGDGDDLIDGGDDADSIEGGAGFDTVTFEGSNVAVRVDLAARIGQGGFAQGDLITGVEGLIGTDWNDTLQGGLADNRIEGRAGRDLIEGRDGDDTLLGETGNDTLVGGAGADSIDGGDDADTADYRGSAAGVTVSLADGTASGGDATGDVLNGIEHLFGSDEADSLAGDAGDNRLDGGRGDDTLTGGDGDDTLSGGRGADAMIGGAGIDVADYTLSVTGVRIDMADGSAGGGDATGDTFDGIEIVQGSFHDDTIAGDAADNILRGGRGADDIDGRGGYDIVDFSMADEGVGVDLATGTGTAGEALGDSYAGIEGVLGSVWSDTITGGAGDETFDGNWGDDTVSGGAGSDGYVFGYDSGTDLVIEAGAATDTDRVLLEDDIAPKDLSVIRDGDDLLLELERDEGFLIDTLRVTDHFLSPEAGIEEVVFADGTVWDRSQIEALQRLGRFNAADDIYRLAIEDEETLIDPAFLIQNDADEVDGIRLIGVENAVNGTVALTPEGLISFTGDQDFNGDAFFDYILEDAFGRQSSARVEVNVAPVNDAPVGAADGVYAGTEDTVLRISYADLLGNDFDVDGDPLTIVAVTPLLADDGSELYPETPSLGNFPYTEPATHGIVWLDGTHVNFDPRADHFGFAGFRYTLADPDGATGQADVELYLLPVNDAPRSADDEYTIRLERTTDITVASLMSNDYDIEDDGFTFEGVHSEFGGGMVYDAESGVISFTPDALGAAGFSYDLVDDRGARSTIDVQITVIPLNDPPVARDDGPFVTDEDTVLVIDPADLLANDTDDTDPLDEVLFISGLDRFAENGRVAWTDDGMIAFTPRADYNGQAGFKYEVADGNGGFDVGYVNVTILPSNDGPVPRDDIALALEDEVSWIIPGEVFGNDLDPEGDVIFFESVKILGVIDGDYETRSPVDVSYGFDLARLDPGVTATAALADGGDLPEGLVFDAATLTFTGALPDGQTDPLDVTVTLINPADGSTHETAFAIAPDADLTAGVTVQPSVALFDLGAGDWSLRPAGNQPLPGWLEFDAETLQLTKVTDAPLDDTDPLRLQLRFEPEPEVLPDGTLAFGRRGFAIEVLIDPQAEIPAEVNALFANDPFFAAQGLYALPIRADATLEARNESGAPLSDWLSFDAAEFSFEGTPPPVFVGTPPVRVEVADAGLSYSVLTELPVDATYDLTVADGFGTNLQSDRFQLLTPEDFYGQVVVQYLAADEKGGVSEDPAEIVVNVLNTPETPEAVDDAYEILEDGSIAIPFAEILANDFDEDGDAIRIVGMNPGTMTTITRGSLRLIDPSEMDGGSGGSGGTSGADTSGAMGLAMLELEAKIAAFGFETDQAPQPHEADIHCPCCGATFILENGAPTDDGLGGAIAPATGTDFGDLDALTDFLTGGFWTGSDRAHNLTDAGTDPNDGVILYNLTGYDEDADGITVERAELVREAFKLLEATLGIDFEETTETDRAVTDIFFGDNRDGANAQTVLTTGGVVDYSLINIQPDWSGGTSTYNDYTLQTIFHEIGHALGLGHQGFYNLVGDFGADREFDNDSWQSSMMSYFAQTENFHVVADLALLQSPMAVDWMALDDLYAGQGFGVANAFTDDTVWGFNTTVTSDVSDIWATWSDWANATASTLVDGGGIDTLDLSGYDDNTLISLVETTRDALVPSFSNIGGLFGNLTLAEGTVIENAIGGAGAETFWGNDADNRLVGNGGQDTFHDSDGADTYVGGSGTDLVRFDGNFGDYAFDLFEDTIEVIGNAVTDVVDATVDFLSFLDRTLSWRALADEIAPGAADAIPDETPEPGPVRPGITADGLPTLADGVYLLSMTDGSDVPFWLSIDRDTGVISGDVPFNIRADLMLDVTLTNGTDTYVQTITVAADGNEGASVVFTPDEGWNGTYTVGYVITDDAQGTGEGQVVIEVLPVNDPPEAVADRLTVNEDTALVIDPATLTANDIDVDGDPLTVLSVSNPSNGTVTFENGQITFTPTANYDGPAGFDYVVSDGADGEDTGRVEITVVSTNRAPDAVTDRFAAVEDEPLTIAIADLLANDIDPDGDPFTFVGIDSTAPGARSFLLPGGEIQFVPDEDVNGEIVFTYRVTDGRATGTGQVVLDVAPVNDGPRLSDDPVIAGTEDTLMTVDMAQIIANDTDIEGDTFTVTRVYDPENGSVTLDGTIATFTPRADYFGNAGFRYVVTDARGATSEGFVNITLSPENDLPQPVLDRLVTDEDQPLEISAADLLANDVDPDGDTLTLLSVNGATQLANGNWLFTPRPDNFEEETLTYTVTDGGGMPVLGQIIIDLIPVPDDPRASDDTLSGTEDTVLTVFPGALLDNDVEPDLQALTITGFDNMMGLSVEIDALGQVVITPDANHNGLARFDYTVADSTGRSDTARVTVTFAAVNDAPEIAAVTLAGTEDTAFAATLDPAIFSDVDGDPLQVGLRGAGVSALPAWLAFDLSTLTLSGMPPKDFNGNVALELFAFDGMVETVEPLTLTIAPVNDAPEIAPIALDGTEDAALAITLDAAAFIDVDGDTLTIDLRGAGGAALPDWLAFDPATLALTGTPPADFNGDVALEVAAFDGTVETVAPVILTIAPAPDAPRAQNDFIDIGTDLVVTVNVADLLANDSDPDGDALVVTSVTGGDGFDAVLEGETVTLTRDPRLGGQIAMGYEVSDGTLTDQAVLLIDLEVANRAPAIAAFGPLTGDEDAAFDIAIPADAITDPDGDALTLTVARAGGTALPDWLSFDADTLRLTGTPPAHFFGTVALQISAGDGQLSATRSFDLVIAPVNDAPTLSAPLSDRSATEDTPFAVQLQQGLYSDIDGDALSFALKQADGLSLPDWIAFDTETLTLTGQAPQDFFGDVELRLEISDGQAVISDDFTLSVAGTPDAPVLVTPLPDIDTGDTGLKLSTGTPFVVTAPLGNFADPDEEPLQFAARLADGSALPGWLSFDGSSFAGTASRDGVGPDGRIEIELLASDGTDTVSDVFALDFDLRNSAPVAADDAFDITVPNILQIDQSALLANDSDADAGDTLQVIAVGEADHGTVSFEDGVVTYLADFDHNGTDRFTYTVSDGADTAEATVTVTVDNPFDRVETGGGGSDFLFGRGGDDLILAGAGRDFLFASRGDDYVDGGRGNDLVSGGQGNDTLLGGAGRDTIFAGSGDDVIAGGRGNDRIFGGSGRDSFRFETGDGSDVIYGFETARARRNSIIPGDELRLSVEGIDSFADLMANASQTGGGVLLDLGGGDQIFLAGTRLAALDEDQFTFY